MKFYNGKLYTCGGGYNIIQDLMRPGCIQVMDNATWSIYEDDIEAKTGASYIDIVSLDINPTSNNKVMASGRTGLYEFTNCKLSNYYSYDNSLLNSVFQTNKDYTLVQGLTYDKTGNLWLANSMTDKQNLIELTVLGEWISFKKNELNALPNLAHFYIDSRNLLWIANDNWQKPSIYAYQPSSDGINSYTSFINEDGTQLELTNIRSITEDKDNNMWFGTNIGPLVLTAKEITSSNPVFEQIKVPRNDGTNLADYLLAGIDITCIAIDGGGRKWIGTNGNGVYLISEDNYTQEAHFTTNNSYLLSDYIESIAINSTNGEVFIGTTKGLCSYNSGITAPTSTMNTDNTYAYPNPVKPEYTGNITIVGLNYDADVKIVTSNGTLVAQGRSTGGTFIWNGKDLNGKRVASGIYMVEVATSEGDSGTVCKIAVIN
jgi:hypothetical protein